jgi:hypothetical protein
MALAPGLYAQMDIAPTTASLGATTSTSAISLGSETVHFISATGAYHIKVGTSGLSAASATDFYIPAGVIYTLYLNRNNTHIRIYNPGASAINYFIQPVEKT